MPKDKEDFFLDEQPDDKTYRCKCDGKHVCKECAKKERDYYEED